MGNATITLALDSDLLYSAERGARLQGLTLTNALLSKVESLAEDGEDIELHEQAIKDDNGIRYPLEQVMREFGM